MISFFREAHCIVGVLKTELGAQNFCLQRWCHCIVVTGFSVKFLPAAMLGFRSAGLLAALAIAPLVYQSIIIVKRPQ